MKKSILSLLAVLLVSLSVASASLWGAVTEVQNVDGNKWTSVPEPILYGNDIIKNIATGESYQFFEVQPSRDFSGDTFSSGGQVWLTFNGMTKQGYLNVIGDEAMPASLEPPKEKIITQEFSKWPTGKTFKNSIPGYYTGRDIKGPEPILFTEKPILMPAQTSSEVVVLSGSGAIPTVIR